MAARRGPGDERAPQGQLAATTTSFGCSAGLSFMDVTKPQLLGVMSFISEMNAQPWLSAGFASQAATSSVTSADKKALLNRRFFILDRPARKLVERRQARAPRRGPSAYCEDWCLQCV